ncbi:hypothetical protein HDU76_006234 [Blyttiomyces sp. JEL0837]|nr:hypothetical protein HDU76_006234 [Blyttiomyces sp. JEL0837]
MSFHSTPYPTSQTSTSYSKHLMSIDTYFEDKDVIAAKTQRRQRWIGFLFLGLALTATIFGYVALRFPWFKITEGENVTHLGFYHAADNSSNTINFPVCDGRFTDSGNCAGAFTMIFAGSLLTFGAFVISVYQLIWNPERLELFLVIWKGAWMAIAAIIEIVAGTSLNWIPQKWLTNNGGSFFVWEFDIGSRMSLAAGCVCCFGFLVAFFIWKTVVAKRNVDYETDDKSPKLSAKLLYGGEVKPLWADWNTSSITLYEPVPRFEMKLARTSSLIKDLTSRAHEAKAESKNSYNVTTADDKTFSSVEKTVSQTLPLMENVTSVNDGNLESKSEGDNAKVADQDVFATPVGGAMN